MAMNKLFLCVLVILSSLLIACSSCPPSLDEFDSVAKTASLPFVDENSLCYGLSMASDFSEVEPVWVVGKLTNVSEHGFLTFEGYQESVFFSLPSDKEFVVGEYYRIDMMNVCRSFFMMADSRYPSPLSETVVEPDLVTCD